jgi:uncharacterized protein YbcI
MATRQLGATTSRLPCVSYGSRSTGISPGEDQLVYDGAAAMPWYAETRLISPVPMKTRGEIETAIREGISRFEQDYMGRGPKDIRVHLLGDLLVVRLQGVLTAAEQHLAKSLWAEKGLDLLKQVRTHLIETARPVLEAMVHKVTGVKVLSLHHDISTVTGEKVVLFTLADAPVLRDVKKK